MKNYKLLIKTVVLGGILLLASCGEDDNDSDNTTGGTDISNVCDADYIFKTYTNNSAVDNNGVVWAIGRNADYSLNPSAKYQFNLATTNNNEFTEKAEIPSASDKGYYLTFDNNNKPFFCSEGWTDIMTLDSSNKAIVYKSTGDFLSNITADANGNLYFYNQTKGEIQKYSSSSDLFTTVYKNTENLGKQVRKLYYSKVDNSLYLLEFVGNSLSVLNTSLIKRIELSTNITTTLYTLPIANNEAITDIATTPTGKLFALVYGKGIYKVESNTLKPYLTKSIVGSTWYTFRTSIRQFGIQKWGDIARIEFDKNNNFYLFYSSLSSSLAADYAKISNYESKLPVEN